MEENMSNDVRDLVKKVNREKYINLLAREFEVGQLSRTQFIKAVAEYDVLATTKRTLFYSLFSTTSGAISAVAAAFSAYFSYLGLAAHH
jgi:hypothetical protein